jgi:hypothetical protein
VQEHPKKRGEIRIFAGLNLENDFVHVFNTTARAGYESIASLLNASLLNASLLNASLLNQEIPHEQRVDAGGVKAAHGVARRANQRIAK